MNSKIIIFISGIVIIVLATLYIIKEPSLNENIESSQPKRDKPLVTTTFYPTQYFTKRIVGNLLDVHCLVPSDEDAIFWMPDADAIRKYQSSDLIVLNGASFAKWVNKVSLPLSRIVDSAKPFKKEFIYYENATTHSHGKGGEHSHEGLDGHTWVDPIFALQQASVIHNALAKRWPTNSEAFSAGYKALESDLLNLDKTLKTYQKSYKNQPILASHPAYNYIARRYGWNIYNLDLDPETMPEYSTLIEIKELLLKFPAKVLLWESNPTPAVAEKIKQSLGLDSVEFSPCELLDEGSSEDYLTIMKNNLKNIKPIFIP